MAEIDWKAVVAGAKSAAACVDVPPEQALYVRFGVKPAGVVFETKTYEVCDGSTLAIDFGPDGKIYGIEVV
jgi:hypothetical protein